tara:strand:+ start:95 stop:568 length:474 start_codon:yes stop_codon:yes gene_type:complete
MAHIFYKSKSDLYKSIVEKHTKLKLSKATRQFDYVFARGCYYYLCRTFGEMSFGKISKTVGKNHATVMHSLKELPYIIKHDKSRNVIFQKIVSEVKEDYFIPKTKKTIDQLVLNHNYYLLENGNLKNHIKRLESKLKKLKDKNKEMKRVIYIMADVD